ncbi:GATA zinc finger domain-containing protein 16-like isoform X1 [Cydia pomonella]|uniref:GATA zinc finger domain-containing protein 16-like isoform X1 n=1 Tax=Cydia pomonella TaxID=82600 RepID=UPI002ADDA3F2|nr:GATA zinc finger domain-containing protein 16-like isoform X1 [Cydia pomonella]
MKLLWFLLVVAVAAQLDDIEEEELEEPYNEEDYEHSKNKRNIDDFEHSRTRRDIENGDPYEEIFRTRRDIHEPFEEHSGARRDINGDYKENYRTRRDVHEGPFEEHIRVKRCTYEDVPISRVRRSVRTPRQVHQYEVHEFTDGDSYPSPPYEEMLAASAEHYHKVYAAPNTRPDVSVPVVYRPVPSVLSPVPYKQARQISQPLHTQPHQTPVQASYAKIQTPQVPQYSQNLLAKPQVHQLTQPSNPVALTHQQPFLVPVKSSIRVANAPNSFQSSLGIIQAKVPLSSEVAVATVEEIPLLKDQQEAAAVVKHHKHATGHTQGGGHSKHAQHDAHKGGKSSSGFKHDHHVDKGAKGFKTDELHRKEYEEAEGKKKKHHDKADHKGSHEEEAHGHKGSKFDEKKGHKKGHKTKGYHNKYHKDEFHKEHKFYDDYHKSGEHHRYGKFNAKHASNESGKKKAHHVNAGHDFVERGKKGYSNKGHLDADHKGYNGKQGHEEHHEKHSSHGKKGGKEGGSHWKHAKN